MQTMNDLERKHQEETWEYLYNHNHPDTENEDADDPVSESHAIQT